MAAPSFDDLLTLGKAETLLRRPELGVRPGDISEMILAAAAAMADRAIGWFAERIAATFLDGATGDDLTQLVADHWSLQRRAATFAIAQVTFNRASPDATIQTFPIGTVVASEKDSRGNDVQYSTTQEASWSVSVGGTVTVSVEAINSGVSGNLTGANLITRIVSTPPAGGTYTITASTQPVGGAEAETDSELRDRARIYPSTLRRATPGALEYAATQTPGISVAKASAVSDVSGFTTVYVADASGGSTGSPATVGPSTTDDGTMTHKVAIFLYDWVAAGAVVTVSGGSVQTVAIAVSLAVRLGVDVAQLITDVQASIQGRVAKLNIGETLYLSEIVNAVKAVDPDNIVNVTVTSPLTDTAPSTPGNVIRAGTITVS